MVWNRKLSADAKSAGRASYPSYDMQYLANALKGGGTARTKYETPTGRHGLNAAGEAVYAQQATADFRSKADNELRGEFSHWLQGQHTVNENVMEYDNTRLGIVQRKRYLDGEVGNRDK